MQRKWIIAILFLLLAACSSAPATDVPATNISPTATEKPIALPSPYAGTLELVASKESPVLCDKVESPFTLPSEGLIPLGFLPNRKCNEINADLDLFEIGDRLYVAQRNARGFRLVDVTDPTQPIELGVWQLEPRAGKGHIKAFRQLDRMYLALPLESPSPYTVAPCGLLVIEVTQPQSPVLQGRDDGSTLGSSVPWCNVHSVEVDADAEGNATFLFVATPNTSDLRVLDVRNLDDVRDMNAFHLHIHPHGEYGSWAHRATVVGNRVYISYWVGGVMIVDKHKLEMGLTSEEVILTPPDSIDPADFVAHDSQPTADGNFLFVNDMDKISDGIRLFDIRDLSHPREIWTSDLSDTETGHHTLQIHDDLIFAPWFREGLRVFRFDLGDPSHPLIEQVAFQSVRKPPYARADGGVSELKVHPCQIEGISKTCIYASDEEMGLIILALEND